MESIGSIHDIHLDNVPTFFEKKAREAIRTGRLVGRHLVDGTPNLSFCKFIGKHVKVMW